MSDTRRNASWARDLDGTAQQDTAAPSVPSWKLRYDAANLAGAGETLPARDVLSFFRKQLRPDAEDGERRASPRVPAVERSAWLGWWEDDEFLIAPAILDNISRGGVRLVIPKPITISQACWLCIGPPSPVVGVRSEVVGIGRVAGGFEIRLAFTMECPDTLYEIVAHGRLLD